MSLNSVALTGRAGKDVELKYTPSGVPVANVSMAVDYGSGENKKTSWIDVVFFKKTAEIAGQYIKKGTLFGVSGYLSARTWEDQSGQKRKTTEVVGANITLLEPKREGDTPAAKPQTQRREPEPEISDEDIPF
jgi:single-strand DNA-binding protein